QEQVLRPHHVVVRVLRKARAQAIARLARLAVADAVRKDDEVARGVEKLAGAEELSAERLGQKAGTGAARAVQDQDGVADDAGRVAPRRADRAVVQRELGQRLAGGEPKAVHHEIAFDRRGKIRRGHRASDDDEAREKQGPQQGAHTFQTYYYKRSTHEASSLDLVRLGSGAAGGARRTVRTRADPPADDVARSHGDGAARPSATLCP